MMKFEIFVGVSAGLCSPAYEWARTKGRLVLSKAKPNNGDCRERKEAGLYSPAHVLDHSAQSTNYEISYF
jgi:hypothetical protein